MKKRIAGSLALFLLLGLATHPLAAQEEERPEWSVDHTWAPTRDVSFEVSEGTWMDLDVSPDGRTVVFDLLGDIYTMPIAGGRATRISGGPAFEFQPRFSPDGARIAFVSDRDGLNNIWTMSPTGEDPRQITTEGERDVNTPSWSADGEYVFARKHYVFSRSLGAGEIWMWHTSGGSGLQVTDRPNEQQDQGEPAAGPKGEWVYYSQDVTQGPFFQYNKDPYAGIYAIRRRNLETGEAETVTGGPGGAIAPTPHPDGRRLAFVRRVRLKTVLYIRDLETGEEWPVWDGLEHDMQEAWAIHGPQARFAWVGDSDDIVVWAQGKIWRVDTGSGEATEIPFTAPVDVRVQQAVRHDVEVAPEAFDVKMLRHVDTGPDGSVVYSALGRVWVKDMPDGEPRRLTDADRIELFPRFSPDGERVVFVTWDDDDMGDVRVAPAGGGTSRIVVDGPGHFAEPAWSPDGSRIVYRRIGGDSRRGRTHVGQRGIYVVASSGGESRLVREGGSGAAFDATGERIIFTGFESGSPALQSADLNGEDVITHFTGANVQEWTVSPDNEWVAFVQGWKAYIARFPHTGRSVALSPSAGGYPVQQVSAETGTFLHWAPDSRALHWTLGPEYFTRGLEETFAFLAGDGAEPAEPEARGVNIGFRAETDVPSGTVAFVGGRVITAADDPTAHGASGGVIENGTVVVERNRIVAVGPASEVEVPSGAHMVNASGKTLMPGMVDAHAHFGSAGGGITAQTDWPYYANLAFGVTTGHDPSNSTDMIFTDAEMVRAGMKTGPRIFSTGTILYGAVTPFRSKVDTYQDALMHVRRQRAAGASAVKSYNQRRRDARQWILEAADAEGINVVPEGGSTFNTNVSQVIDGHTTVEHNLPLANLYDDVIGLWSATEVAYTPTLVVTYGGPSGEYYFYEHYNVWENERLMRFTPPEGVDARSRRRQKAAGDGDYHHIDVAGHVNELNQAGVLTNTGAHGQRQGLAMHWETWMFTQGGMDPMRAIKSATINGARSLGLGDDLGSIETGKLADIVVLDANPLEDIHNTETVRLVMVNGRLYDAWTMDQVGNHPEDRPTLAHERAPAEAPGLEIR